MSIKTIEYKVNIAGITPATEQFGGTQGDHKVTMIEFVTDDLLNDKIIDYANEINGKAMYRFDVYDGEGGIWSSEPKELEYYTLSMELEERHTRHGGKVTIYLVMTVLSPDCETEIELYSFPAVLRLKNRPEGTYQDGENYESVTSLAESAKSNALAAEKSNKELQAFASQIEEKLKNGEFDGVSVTHSFDGTVLKMTSASGTTEVDLKGEKGDIGPKGDKGDDGKDAVTDLTYKPESSNAQSGKAVAEAANVRIPKPTVVVGAPIKTVSVMSHNDYTTITDPDTTINKYIANDSAFIDVIVDDGTVWSKENVEAANGCIPTRDDDGNLWTGTPKNDVDCANKKYVDNAIKNAGGGGTTNYEELDNKPKINNIELKGEMTANDLSLVDKGTFDKTIGDTETTLDKIIEIQEAYINGNYVNGVTITDKTTSLNYKLYVDNGKLKMEVI